MTGLTAQDSQSYGRERVDDHALWLLLRASVARRPALPAMGGVFDSDPQRVAKQQISMTVRVVADFEREISDLLRLKGPSSGVRGPRAVARMVVRMCDEFEQRWPRLGAVTKARMTEFEHEVEVLEVALDAIAPRKSRSPF